MSGPPADANVLQAFRILKRKFARAAFSGDGARLYGGRWNSAGVAVVYTSSSVALALLEWRCHLTQWPSPPVVLIPIEFDAALVWSPPKLPAHWRRYPCSIATRAIGDDWVRSGTSAVMKVPSATVPEHHEEYNYLLNPAHSDFHRVRMGKPQVFEIDQRLGPLRGL